MNTKEEKLRRNHIQSLENWILRKIVQKYFKQKRGKSELIKDNVKSAFYNK